MKDHTKMCPICWKRPIMLFRTACIKCEVNNPKKESQ